VRVAFRWRRVPPRHHRYERVGRAGHRSESVKALGDAARSAPWQARFDSQGRLVWLSVSVPAAAERPAVASETSYSAFGEPVTVDRPPARETVEAPESLYKLFGG
jgi:hypothetical protein